LKALECGIAGSNTGLANTFPLGQPMKVASGSMLRDTIVRTSSVLLISILHWCSPQLQQTSTNTDNAAWRF